MESDKIVVMTTAGSFDEAASISKLLIKKRLAACCSVLQNVQSTYWWKGEIIEDAEVIVLIKSQKSVQQELIETIKSVHSYEVPEILCLPVIGGYIPYLQWISDTVAGE